ncbi:MAG: hypothetical protein KDA60_00070 [Planctomycetales bacterium]|nr:hypothetical protein [Planctomycetales bacterium]
MSTDVRSSANTQVVSYDAYVDDQLQKVSTYVRLNDLASHVLGWAAYTLGCLLVLAVVDHWIVDLGNTGRLVGFATLVLGFLWGVFRGLLPLLFRRINPAYAAQVIERGEPSLKNSLLNFVFFRRQQEQIREIVYSAVQRQAATRLSEVEVDSTIDRTAVVRAGLALAIFTVLFALYGVFSPKSPFATAARVLAPWRDIARPSRVHIEQVTPGDTQVYAGRTVEVAASVAHWDQAVDVVFSSVDGQIVKRRVSLVADESTVSLWKAVIPPEGEGIYQDMQYRIEAGDATAGPFHISVRPAPSMIIESIEYDYPDYTGKPTETVTGDADIRGPEGTRVTIHATSNQPMQFAYLDFDPDTNGASADELTRASQPVGGAADLSRGAGIVMKHDEQSAHVSFVLRMLPDRQSPWHTSYQIRFVNNEGESNPQPIQYRIDVLPDLSPLVDILQPQRQQIAVPENGSQDLDFRARDPDYGLTQFELRLARNGTEITSVDLLEAARSTGTSDVDVPVQTRYPFSPRQLGLKAGQTITYRAMAADNRHDPISGELDSNISQTPVYQIKIMPPRQGADAESAADRSRNQPAEDEQPGRGRSSEGSGAEGTRQDKSGEGQGQGQDGEPSGNQGGPSTGQNTAENAENSRAEGQSSTQSSGDTPSQNSDASTPAGEPGEQAGTPDGNDSKSSDENSAEDAATDSHPSASTGGEQSDSMNQAGDESTSADDAAASDRRAADGSSRSGRNGDSSQTSDGSPTADGGSESRTERSTASGQSADGETSSQSRAPTGDNKSGGEPGGGTGPPISEDAARHARPNPDIQKRDPLSSDGAQDGEAMDRILERIRERTGRTPENARPDAAAGDAGDADEERDSPAGTNERAPESEEKHANSGSDANNGANPGQGQANPDGTVDPSTTDEPANSKGPNGAQSGAPRAHDTDASTGAGDPQAEAEQGASGQPADERDASPGQGNPATTSDPTRNGQPGDDPRGRDTDEAHSGKQQAPNPANSSTDSKSADPDVTADRDGTGEPPVEEGHAPPGQPNGEPSPGSDADRQPSGQPEGADSESGENPGDADSSTDPSRPHAASSDSASSDSASSDSASSDSASSDSSSAQSSPSGTAGPRTGASSGGTDTPATAADSSNEALVADKANLDYARQATDLVLDYLKHEQNRQDDELRERLGWTPAEMEEFVKRWQQLRRDAARDDRVGRDANHELNDALRSLGLIPEQDRVRRAGSRQDNVSGVRDAGTRSEPPSKYREQWQRYLKSK